MKLSYKDFWPGEHMFSANLATLASQVEAANRWIEQNDVKVLNAETLFRSEGTVGGSGPVSNVTGAHGVRVWYMAAR